MSKTLLAFHGDPKVKAKYLRRVRAHEKADEIIHGVYWEKGRGCGVGGGGGVGELQRDGRNFAQDA